MPSRPVSEALPVDLPAIERQLDANDASLEAVLQGLGEAEMVWQPGPAAWSIAQCLDHLARASRSYVDAMRQGLAAAPRGGAAAGPIRPGLPSRWFLRSLEPPPRRRIRAPAKIVPALGRSGREAADDFRAEQVRLREFLRAAAAHDLNRIRFVNPFIPLLRFTVGTGLLVIAAHERRHLWQAGQVRAHPAFPGPTARPAQLPHSEQALTQLQ